MSSASAPAAPNPTLFFETINAYQRTAALRAALDLGLFTSMRSSAQTAVELAALCKSPVRGIRILCDSLAIMGFLIKEGEEYSLTPDSAFFLVEDSPAFLGGTVRFLKAPGIADAFDHLTDTIRTGRVHLSEKGTTAPDHPVWVEFARSMGPMMAGPAFGAAALIDLDASKETKILDVSASHGTFGIALAKKSPQAHLVALDWAAVLEVTEESARAAGLEGRFSKLVGDAFSVDLGTGYDVVLVPNFLHHFSLDKCTEFLRKVKAALRPGGKVAIVEFIPNEDRVSPQTSAMFSLVMLGTTPEGDAYTFAEFQQMLVDAGFTGAELHPLLPTAQSLVLATA